MSWKDIEFKDFITLQRGFDLPINKMQDGHVPVLGSNCIVGYHNEAKAQPPGVITGRSGTLGVVQYTEEPYWPHNTSLWVKDFKNNHHRFVYYKLQTLNLARFNGGASVPTLNRNVLDSLKLRIPEFKEQERAAAVIADYDELIENNRRRIQLLEESARLLYREWFVYFRFPGHEHVNIVNGAPNRWEKTILAKLCYEEKEIVQPNQVESDTPYIGLEHIPRRSITLDTWGTSDEVTSTKHKYHEGDILFGKIRPYFHKVGFSLTDGIASSDSIVIRSFSDEHWPLVLMIVSSDHFVAVSSKTAKEGSKMPRADWKQMQNFPVALPPQSILSSFNESIIIITSMLKALALQNRKLKEARVLLLPRLMNGEIKV